MHYSEHIVRSLCAMFQVQTQRSSSDKWGLETNCLCTMEMETTLDAKRNDTNGLISDLLSALHTARHATKPVTQDQSCGLCWCVQVLKFIDIELSLSEDAPVTPARVDRESQGPRNSIVSSENIISATKDMSRTSGKKLVKYRQELSLGMDVIGFGKCGV